MDSSSRKVSCRTFPNFILYVESLGIPVEKLFEGLGMTREHAEDVKKFVDWDVFAAFMDRFEALVGGPEKVVEYGMQVSRPKQRAGKSVELQRALNVAGYFASSKNVYWLITRWFGPSLFSQIKFEYQDLGDGRVRVTMEIPKDLRAPLAFFKVWQGSLATSPATVGQADAIVETEITDHRAVYTITPPPSYTIFSRIWQAWRILVAAKSTVEELAFQQAQIKSQYEKLLAAQATVLEQEVKLKLSSQMTNLAKMSALGEMSGGLAHEINNPLAVVLGKIEFFEQLAKDGELDSQSLLAELQKTKKVVIRIADIVRGLRAFARNADQDPFERVSTEKIVNDALQLCGEKFRDSQIDLTVSGVSPSLALNCRPTQIVQVLLNLLNNAFDAVISSSERQIRIEAAPAGNQIEISVSDSGAGVQPEIRDKLFQPFFTTKPIGQGTGLGLSISLGLAESNRGTLFLDTQSSRTRFVLRLPKTAR